MTHDGFLGIHEGDKADCAYCNLPEGKLVTEQELVDYHKTLMQERFESVPEEWRAALVFPWAVPQQENRR